MPDSGEQLADVPWRWFAWGIRVRDDRGVVRPAAGVRERSWWLGGSLYSELMAYAWTHWTDRPLRGLGIMLVAGPMPALCLFGGSSVLRSAGVNPFIATFCGGVVGVVLMVLLFRFTITRWSIEEYLRDHHVDIIKRGACLACGYAIAGIAQEDDGCRVCPECGAAWNPDAKPRERPRPSDKPWVFGDMRDRLFDWRLLVPDARAVPRRVRWVKERWMWGAPLPASFPSTPAAIRWRRWALLLTALVALGGVAMVCVVALERMEMWGEGYNRKYVGITLIVGALLLRFGPVRLSAERAIQEWSRSLRPGDPCPACGGSLETAREYSPGRVECPSCKAIWAPAPAIPGAPGE
jgi:hypothetical protein